MSEDDVRTAHAATQAVNRAHKIQQAIASESRALDAMRASAEVARAAEQLARFSEILKRVGGSNRAAEIAGVSRNTIYEWSKGNKRIPLNGAVMLSEAANVSVDWLASGRDSGPVSATSDVAPAADFVAIPRLEVRASAGYGLAVTSDVVTADKVMMLSRLWLRKLDVTPGNAELLEASGDSMEPTIRDGDLMLLNRGYGEVADGFIYVLVVNGLVIVKRLQVLARGGLLLISDNPRYPAETVPPSEMDTLSIQARVVWYGRAL